MEIHTYNNLILLLQILPYFTQWTDINMYKKKPDIPIKFKLLCTVGYPEKLEKKFLKQLYSNYKLIRDKTLWHECIFNYNEEEEENIEMTDVHSLPNEVWQYMLVIIINKK